MIRRLARRSRRHDDKGAALILALVIVTIAAMAIAALLSFADTSVRTTVALRVQGASAYNADGAAQAAVNLIRQGSFNNDVGQSCLGSSNNKEFSNFYAGTTGSSKASAYVSCTPDPNSGAAGGLVPITAANKPGNAILTLGTDPLEDGINVKPLSSTLPFSVHGTIVSDSNIDVKNGTLQSNAAITAHTGCNIRAGDTGAITSSPPVNCSGGAAADPNYQFEPAYESPANIVPTYQAVPARNASSCPGKLVSFNPGYYDDAGALSSLMDGGGSNPCAGSVWWFKPGTYYFDFHNSANPLLNGTSDVWTIKDGQLVAGTPVDSTGTVLAAPPVPASIPGSCQNPIKSVSAVGVQFIFGGDSQLAVTGGDVEICGTYHPTRPPIAVYGQKTGTETTSSLTGANTVKWSQVTSAGDFTATSVNQANIDGTSAIWPNTAGGSGIRTGTVTVNDSANLPAIPAGSVLSSATLRVAHGNATSYTSQDAFSVVLTPVAPSTGSSVTVNFSSALTSGLRTDSIDLWGSGSSAFAKLVHDNGLSSANLKFNATLKHSGAESLDGIQLDLTYTAPAFRGETTAALAGNCLAATYTGGAAGQCAVLSSPTSYSGKFYVQGTTYVPIAPIDLALSNITTQVMRFGVIARSLRLKEVGGFTYSGPIIEVPDDSPGFGPGGTIVYLSVYVCPLVSRCDATTGTLRLRAKVLIKDPTGVVVAGARQITIQSWSVQR
jgi:hypothetical protein